MLPTWFSASNSSYHLIVAQVLEIIK